MRRLRSISLRDLLAVGVPAVVLLVAGFWLAAQFIKPAPPESVTISTGSDGGAYQTYAVRYKEILSRFGVNVVEMTSAGSQENLKRLLDTRQAVDVGFIQGGIAARGEAVPVRSLGSVYFEPLWVFYRGKHGLTRLDQLAGKRLAIGPAGSGTQKLAMELLEAHGMLGAPTRLLPLAGLAAVQALKRGEVDAVLMVGSPYSGPIWLLLHTEGVALMSFELAEAYTRRFQYLSQLTLPAGAISFPREIPPRDVRLVAPVAQVVVREDIHPALIDLLLQAMKEVHREPGLFQRAGEFPSATQVDFPLNERAARYFQSGPPLLQRYLPFWVANFVDRVMVMLLPVIALLIPLVKITPSLYTWRVRSRIYRWYGELKFLELDAQTNLASRSRDQWMSEIERIEQAVNRIAIPLAYTDFVYTLRSHIMMVRLELLRRLGEAPPAAAIAGAEGEPG